MNKDDVLNAVRVLKYMADHAATLAEGKTDAAEMLTHLRKAEAYLNEYGVALRDGTEPYDALIAAASEAPKLTAAFDKMVKARENWMKAR